MRSIRYLVNIVIIATSKDIELSFWGDGLTVKVRIVDVLEVRKNFLDGLVVGVALCSWEFCGEWGMGINVWLIV